MESSTADNAWESIGGGQRSLTRAHVAERACGVVASRPLCMQKALGSIPSVRGMFPGCPIQAPWKQEQLWVGAFLVACFQGVRFRPPGNRSSFGDKRQSGVADARVRASMRQLTQGGLESAAPTRLE